ncbi:JAB domain-containing protein [Peribacillus loiseleuriae]|nr:JAB domain-containing protein [Peribacillus loiseleuriae]
MNASIVHSRDVMKSAILNNAASIIVSHISFIFKQI